MRRRREKAINSLENEIPQGFIRAMTIPCLEFEKNPESETFEALAVQQKKIT